MQADMDDIAVITKYFPNLEDSKLDQLRQLGHLFQSWNERINLVSRKDIDSFYQRHILHSLAIDKLIDIPSIGRIMDLGTGGGLPGLPLAILNPDTDFMLVDSIRKKVRVVDDLASNLNLKNVSAQWTRVEDVSEKFDLVVTRAVAPVEKLLSWIGSKSPRLAALKGGDLSDEIASIPGDRNYRLHAVKEIFEEEFFQTKYLIEIS